jgi:hypothetical protein
LKVENERFSKSNGIEEEEEEDEDEEEDVHLQIKNYWLEYVQG